MSLYLEDSDKHALLSIIFKEYTNNFKSPAYEYAKTGNLLTSPHLIGALGCAIQLNNEDDLISGLSSNNDDIFLNCDENDLRQIFSFRRQTLKDLIQLMEHRLFDSEDIDGTPIPVAKKILLTCWLLTSTEEYSVASDVFKISIDAVLHVFLEVCAELTKLSSKIVNWPTSVEESSVIEEFEMAYGFPGVVGVIGSTTFHINFPSVSKDSQYFYNPASDQHSIIIQAVCDHKMIFRDICAGVPSRRLPSEILRDSPLYENLVSRTSPLMKPQTFILGNSDYPQLPNLLTPYAPEIRGRPLDETEHNFNKQHSIVESLIHKCFDMLRTRFKKLNNINVSDTSKATHIVLASCVLHNFALMRDDILN